MTVRVRAASVVTWLFIFRLLVFVRLESRLNDNQSNRPLHAGYPHLVVVAVEDGVGEGAEEAEQVAGAEPGPEQGVVTPGVERGAEEGGLEAEVIRSVLELSNNLTQNFMITEKTPTRARAFS